MSIVLTVVHEWIFTINMPALLSFTVFLVPVLFGILIYLKAWELALTAVALLLIVKYRKIFIILKTLPRDIRFLYRMSQMKIESSRYKKNDFSVGDVFAEQLKKNPKRDCIYFEGKTWKAIDVEEYSNRVAHVFQKAGYVRGDVVSLLMGNRPEYVCIWLGLSKIGVITALINTNLKKNSLLHCFLIAKSKAIIFSETYAEVVKEIEGDIPENMTWYRLNDGEVLNESDKIKNLNKCLESAPVTPVDVEVRPSYKDHLMYIFTSGTTGLPKAAVMPHSRYLLAGQAAICLLKLTKDDIIYNPLPMYHTAGGALGIGAALMSSTSVVIRPKFSASNYFSDCVKYKCTIGQYIGEMCRYILATPVKPGETNHRLRLMIGNGMRASIWSRFVQRFQIPQITEVYGATEGNVNICNLDNTIGAIGCFPKCLPQFLFPIAIIRVDEETGQPCRNVHGFCERCEVDEPGMLVGLIKQNDPTRQFHGYVDSESSKKKTIENVFKKGDRAFVSGDLVVQNELGYIFFKDRTGDTFRWKGENVATTEVEAVISSILGLKVCTVYGVEVGENEGKAGMAAIADPSHQVDLAALAEGLDKELPVYARPLFVRILDSIEMTGTFKIKKVQLQKEGFNPENVVDKLFYRKGKTYIPLTLEIFSKILSGVERL